MQAELVLSTPDTAHLIQAAVEREQAQQVGCLMCGIALFLARSMISSCLSLSAIGGCAACLSHACVFEYYTQEIHNAYTQYFIFFLCVSVQNAQEVRNHKALELLMAKDEQIEELQQQVSGFCCCGLLLILPFLTSCVNEGVTTPVRLIFSTLSLHSSSQVASLSEQLSAAQQVCRDVLRRAVGAESGLVSALRAKEELQVEQDEERGRMAETLVRVFVCVSD